MTPRRPLVRLLASLALLPALLVLGGGAAAADVLTTTEGLVLEGEAHREDDGSWRLVTPEGDVILKAERVAAVREGLGPRTQLLRRQGALESGEGASAAAWYRFAVEAEAAGQPDLAASAFGRVVALEPDHEAARRALGQERVDGRWVSSAQARRQRGLVLFEGRWLLPAQVEARARADEEAAGEVALRPGGLARTREILRTLATGSEPLQRAAEVALAATDLDLRVRAALATLFDADPAVRRRSARLLGLWGDEAALRPLILSAARDLDADVRREATLAAAAFGHDDVAIPFVRALTSEHPRLVANAAEALVTLQDERAAGYIVKRMTSHGSSSRNFVAFLNQVSYVRDYDVEIAQASNIANPDVATIQDGVVLDVKVLDAGYEKTWVERVLVKALGDLVGESFANRDEALAWWAEHGETMPDYPSVPGRRDPRKRSGRILGAR